MKDYLNLREAVSHGTFLLPFELYQCGIPDEFSVLPVHWHEEIEITLITEGSCLYHIDLTAQLVHKGDIIIILPRTLHGVNAVGSQTMSSESFVFHLNMLVCSYPDLCSMHYLHPILDGEMNHASICHPENPGYSQIEKTFRELKRVYQKKDEFFELNLKSELFYLFQLLYRHHIISRQANMQNNPDVTEKIRTAILYIQENYNKDIAITELAKLCHFSNYHFMRFFKKHLHMTCVEYINHYRLMMALKALESTELSITAVALESGFNSVSYFNRQFKQAYHMTPGEYRKNKSASVINYINPVQ